MIQSQSFVNQEGGVRLDAAILLACPTSSRAFVREAIAAGDILVGRGAAALRPMTHKGNKLRGGETVLIRRLLEDTDNLVAPEPDANLRKTVRCCFEDDALLAYDKPAGMPVQPLSCRETGTLMNSVVTWHPECTPLGDRPLMAGALHRIDADTSGLVLVARSAEAFEKLRAQFSAQTVKKTYLALVEGSAAVGGTLENDLVHDPSLPFCKMVDTSRVRANGRFQGSDLKPLHAVTQFAPIGHTTVENEERTLLEVTIYTGVTHQIRAQLALAGMHIVNDRLYGAFAIENQTGHCLHALAATFRHPISGDEMEIRTSLPGWAKI